MSSGKHRLRTAVKGMSRKARVSVVAGIGVGAAVVTAVAIASASASIIGDPGSINNIGEAGIYASMNGPGHFTSIRTTWYVRKAEGTLGISPAHGIGLQIGNDASGNVVQAGGFWGEPTCTNGLEVEYGSGTLTNQDPTGTNTTTINSGGSVGSPVLVSPALCVPQGDYVKVGLYEVAPGEYEIYAKNLTTGVSISKGFAGVAFPDEAGVGVVTDQSTRAGAVTATELANFNSINLTDSNGAHGGFFSSSDWSPVNVASSPTGTSASPLLIAPGANGGTHFKLFAAANAGA